MREHSAGFARFLRGDRILYAAAALVLVAYVVTELVIRKGDPVEVASFALAGVTCLGIVAMQNWTLTEVNARLRGPVRSHVRPGLKAVLITFLILTGGITVLGLIAVWIFSR